MASRTVDEFVAEVNRQTASSHLALKRWVDEVAEANRACFGALTGVEVAAMSAMIDAEIGALQCARSILEANAQSSRSLAEQWVETAKQLQTASLRLVSAGSSIAAETMAPRS